MTLLDGVLVFVAGVFASIGAHAGWARLRQRDEEISPLAALSAVLLAAALFRSRAGDEAGHTLFVALPFAYALSLHVAHSYARPRRRGGLVLAYGAAATLGLCGAFASSITGPVLGFGALVTCIVTWVFARAYLEGRREALGASVAAAILVAATVNDLAVASGVVRTFRLAPLGFVPLVFALSALPLRRSEALRDEFRRLKGALRARVRELRRTHSALRQAQEELENKQQLAAVGELAAVIAHEVRNPLAVVSNAVAGLNKEGLSTEDRTTLLAIVDEEVGRLNRLVTDLLGYARPVALQRTQLPVDDLLERALSLPRTRAGLIVKLENEARETRVWADARHLRQVFDNLIDNAVQAIPDEGTLTVRLRTAVVEGLEYLAVDVVDTGEGMDTTVRKRAKDPFFTTRPRGTGLGLAIVDRIVRAHGGRLIIESRTGEGTTATVLLPHRRPSVPPDAGSESASGSGPSPAYGA